MAPKAAPATPAAVAMAAKPTAPHPPAAKPANAGNDVALEAGGGALALLALGGAAFAIARRRRRAEEEEWYGDETVDHEHAEPAVAAEAAPEAPMAEPHQYAVPSEQPAMVAPAMSAFAWDTAQPCDNPTDDGSDRCPGESWVERAYRGPSPANPSASLKNRLSRAAFFDKREREVAAGRAEPVDPDAGLPDAMVEEQERETA